MAKNNITTEQLEYFNDLATQFDKSNPDKPKNIESRFQSFINTLRDIDSAATAGILSGVQEIGRIASPLQPYTQEEEKNISNFSEDIEKVLPYEKTPTTKAAKRSGRLIPYAVTGSSIGESVLRSIAGGTLGQTLEELGFGETVQNIGEAAPFFVPGFGKKIPTTGEQTELAEFGRAKGLTEEDLALSLGKEGIKDELALEFTPKKGQVARAADKTYKNLQNVWKGFVESPEAQIELPEVQSNKVLNNISKKLSKLPSEVRNKIMTDYNDFIGRPFTGENLADFWTKVNYYVNKGDNSLGIIKSDIKEAFELLDPKLGKDFELLNKLYSNFKKTSVNLKPDIADKLISFGEGAAITTGIITRDTGLLYKALGPLGGRQLAKWLATNPRAQNLSIRLTNALNNNKKALARKVFDELQLAVGENNADAARELAKFDLDQYLESQ